MCSMRENGRKCVMKAEREAVRYLYLVRHGSVAFPEGKKRCIGRTDLPLSADGILQGERLTAYFKEHPVQCVYTSPLARARVTAGILSGGRIPVVTEAGLTEIAMGSWENVPLEDLHKVLTSEPADGEGRAAGLLRMQHTIQKLLDHTEGDIVCVSHAGIICAYLSALMNIPLETSRAITQPYGGISRIGITPDGQMQVCTAGRMPDRSPSLLECRRMLKQCKTPEPVRRHCEKVAKEALEIGLNLRGFGYEPDLELVMSAALLHDILRTEPDHAKAGARYLEKAGYPAAAQIIRVHHDLSLSEAFAGQALTEAEIVYLADKRVSGTQVVSLEERFEKSRRKCMLQPDAKAALDAHERRFREAKRIERKLAYCLRGA